MGTPISANTGAGKMIARFAGLAFGWQYLISIVLALLVFLPIIGNTFVSDDHSVIKKVCIDGQLNTEGFFRPLSDITIYLNYLVFGLEPSGYFVFNIIIHALSALLLFQCCRRWQWTTDPDKQLLTAAIASLFFLVYPFHSESIVWLLGRASLLANTFAMLGLVIMVGNAREYVKIAGVCVCYFIAMTGYESAMVLPAMAFVWLLGSVSPLKRYLVWMSMLTLTLVLHLWLRIAVSGGIAGEYGSGFFDTSLVQIAMNSAKAAGRLFLPPMASVSGLLVLFLAVMLLTVIAVIALWRTIKHDRPAVVFFLQMAACCLIALLVPFYFGVSSHTSESDRFLHFPSFFFCVLLAFCLVNLLYPRPAWKAVVGCILVYFIICLQLTCLNWRKASEAVRILLNTIENHDKRGKLMIVNMPEEIDGAYIFRTAFNDALDLYQLQHDSLQVVNYIKRDSVLAFPGTLVASKQESGYFIQPNVLIVQNGNEGARKQDTVIVNCKEKDEVVYWDKKRWRRLEKAVNYR